MEIFIRIVQFVLSFSLLVIVHEMGHFLFARLFKTRVEKFYIFFDPWFSLFKFKKGDTEFGVGWIPLGGYVKIAGMIDESMDTDQMKKPAQPYEFRSKPAWQRLLIMLGGVMMNVLLAAMIYIGISYVWGETYLATKDAKYGYVYNDVAREIGFQNGDRVVDVAGKPVEDAHRVHAEIIVNQAAYVTVERKGELIRIDIPEDRMAAVLKQPDFMQVRLPFVIGAVSTEGDTGALKAGLLAGDTLVALNGTPMRYVDEYLSELQKHRGEVVQISFMRDSTGVSRMQTLPVQVSSEGMIGVGLQQMDKLLTISTHEYSFAQSIPVGISRVGTEIASYAKQLKLIFSPKTEAYKSLGGFLTIGSIFPTYWSWEAFWHITAFLSIVLAVMNILPIPMLDGGHVLFVLAEMVTRRKPSDKFMEVVQWIGIVIIMGLILFTNGNDIYRFFIK